MRLPDKNDNKIKAQKSINYDHFSMYTLWFTREDLNLF